MPTLKSGSRYSSGSIAVACQQFPRYNLIHHAVLAQATHAPEVIAVRSHLGHQLHYGDLKDQSLRLAIELNSRGIGRGSRVCLLMERSIPPITAILAILQLGAAYVPMDGSSVTDTSLRNILQDANPGITLISRAYMYRANNVSSPHICLEDTLECLCSQHDHASTRSISDDVHPSDCAYIIFTSGTTGRPKGVMITHQNVTNLLCLSPGNLGITRGTCVAQLLNVAFDMCVWETLGCLMNGGTLHLRGPRREDWLRVLRSVEVVICTPSILAQHRPKDYPNIRVVAVAGEPCPAALADEWALYTTFYNCCGPTEVTIVNTMHRHTPGSPLTIGKPTPNNSVYVLDDELRPVSVGSEGMMWAGGLGVCKGYLNRSDLDEKKFHRDPFHGLSVLMYNTGDVGRMEATGDLSHLCRIDDQVKIQGFRVELEGVASAMRTCPGVTQANALSIEGEIWGFYTPENISKEDVIRATSIVQPKYAVPTRLTALVLFPLTTNGKVDKGALRDIALCETRAMKKADTAHGN